VVAYAVPRGAAWAGDGVGELLPIGASFVEDIPFDGRSYSSDIPLLATHRRVTWRVAGYEDVLDGKTVRRAERLELVSTEYVVKR